MAFAIKTLWRCTQITRLPGVRNITMSSNKLAKALENLENNPFYEKYAQRIAELQKTSPEEFLERVERTERSKKADTRARLSPPDTRQYSSVLNPKGDIKGDASHNEKKLEDILKLDLVKDKDASEIQVIWEQYHRSKEVISATIPFGTYKEILERMQKYGTFLFPLPRAQGYEFILSQCEGHTVHFTPLLAYQVHKENAPECLTMVHYTELRDKGIVLMRGEFDKNVLNGQEAQCLANQFQMYYNGKDAAKLQLLKSFKEHPDSFKHMDLVSQLENITLVQYSSVLNPKGDIKGDASHNEKKLEDILKLDLVKDKDASEIQVIWEQYHRSKEVISATIPFGTYKEILERMQKYGTFLFPLPRAQGYEFILSQCEGHTVHFTPLLAYQVHKENAPECLTMVHYTELRDKGIVLMRGEFDKNVLNGQEAQCLANQFQMYYNGKDAAKLQLLKSFKEHPDSFKHMDLVSQLENITLV